MKRALLPIVASAAIGALFAALPACAADNEAGVPLSPRDAAGAWTVESQGTAICTLRLSAARSAHGSFRLQAPSGCGDAIPAGAVGWTPTHDGMALTGADGAVLISFNRWSNSLFVSHRSSGSDLQLKRGGPGPLPGTD
ncbi:MAG TPA: AprI/Inh family metalloprotease inhibitor [Caulobacteraceae bacterium]